MKTGNLKYINVTCKTHNLMYLYDADVKKK